MNLDSQILNNEIEWQFSLIRWIKKQANKDSIQFKKLIYKINSNKKNAQQNNAINEGYYDKGPTLLLIKTGKNKIFGGFTPLNWNKNGGDIYDKSYNTFLFSLNPIKQYSLKDKSVAIKCLSNSGPIFGNNDLIVEQDMKKGKINNNENSSFDNFKESIGEKDESFNIKEIEIYNIIY